MGVESQIEQYLAVVLAAGATASLASTIGHGAIWSQVAALVLMAPAAALGGWACARQARAAGSIGSRST